MVKNKSGQEEIVGFVVIVVLVVIIGVIMLGIGLRKGDSTVEQDSGEIYRFLESAMQYTTECAISYEPAFSSLGDLIEECNSNSGRICVNGEGVCDVLNRDIKEILEGSWKVGEDRPIKGYIFSSSYDSGAEVDEIVKIEGGVCEGGFRGSDYLSPAFPGTITSSLKLCY